MFLDGGGKWTYPAETVFHFWSLPPSCNDFIGADSKLWIAPSTGWEESELRRAFVSNLLEHRCSYRRYVTLSPSLVSPVSSCQLECWVSVCVNVGICSATTPFLLLGDVLDCLPLDQCDKIFSFVEENVSTWKSVNNLQSSWCFSPA